MSDTPAPIDPADIRPGDVVERREVVTVVEAASDYGHVVRNDGTARTWYLIHRPDPDAEAVEALAAFMHDNGGCACDLKPCVDRLRWLARAREALEVVRRAES